MYLLRQRCSCKSSNRTMYVLMYVCIDVCMYVCIDVCMYDDSLKL
jgi:hypothetical protein